MTAPGLTYLGSLSLGAVCPAAVGAIAPVLTQLQAKLTGLTALAAKLTVAPPTVSSNLQLAIQNVTGLTIAVAAGLPGIDAQIATVALQIGQIEAQLQILLQLQNLFATAGIFAFAWDGATSALGGAVSTALTAGWPDGTPPGTHSNALLLATVDPTAWTAMSAFFSI